MPAFKDKKRDTWYASFYYVDWTGAKKLKKKRGFKKQSEAKEWERKFLEKEAKQSDILFGSLVENYLEDMKHRLRETTYEGKKNLIDRLVLPYFKNKPINKIQATSIRKWQNELTSKVNDNGKKYSQTYLKTINNQLTAILNYAVKFYGLERNPCHLAGSMGKKHADSMQIWTLDEYKKFIKVVEQNESPMEYLAFEVLFWSGVRVGELCAFGLYDIKDCVASVTKSYARIKGKTIISPPKTPKSTRDITIQNKLQNKIDKYVAALAYPDPNDRLFPTDKSHLARVLARCAEKAKVKRIRIHDLRHSHASLLIEQGFSPLLISERLGHEKIETTLNIYSHLYPNKHDEVATRLEKLAS